LPEHQEQRALTAVQRRDLEVAQRREAMIASVTENKSDIEQFLTPFGISYNFFVAGLRVFLMRQSQTQPDFFTEVKPASFLEALFRCSKDGLIPDGKEAAISQFKGIATYMPMRDGLVKVLWRTGMIKDINDQVVTREEYDLGRFEYVEGDEGYIKHRPSMDRKDGDEIVAAYCVVRLKDGGVIREVVPKADLKKIAAMSRSPARTAWAAQMDRKAAIRRVMGKMPRAPEIAQVLAHDDDNYDLNAFVAAEPSGVRERLPGKVGGEGFAHHKVEAALLRRPQDIDTVLEGDDIPDEVKAPPEAPAVPDDILQWAADFNTSLPTFTDAEALRAEWNHQGDRLMALGQESPGIANALKKAVKDRLAQLK